MDAQECYEQGIELSRDGKRHNAYKYFKAAAEKDSRDTKYLWTAAVSAPNRNAAFIHAKAAWENGLRTPTALLLLSKVSFYTDRTRKLDYVLSLYSEMPDSSKNATLRGQIFYSLAYHDSALATWKPVVEKNPSPGLLVNVSQSLLVAKGVDSARVFLEKFWRKGKLDGHGYASLASLYSFRYQYSLADSMWAEAKALGHYDLETEYRHLAYLILRGNLGAAYRKASSLTDTPTDSTEDPNPARAILSYIHYYVRDSASIAALKRQTTEMSEWTSQEAEWAEALLRACTREPGGALQEIENGVESGIGGVLGRLAYARELARASKYVQAGEQFEKLPREVVLSPVGIADYALVLAQQGQSEKALAALSRMHGRRLFTKRSLEVFRDITFRSRMFEKSRSAQRLLEAEYGEDLRVRFSGAMLALKTGRIDSAVATLGELHRERPKDPRLEQAYLLGLYTKGDFSKVVSLCESSELPGVTRAMIQARALRKLGKDAEAKKAYAEGISSGNSTVLGLEYANFLLEKGNDAEAMAEYDRMVKQVEQKRGSDTAWVAMIYNNLAWTMLQTEGASLTRAREIAGKAYEVAPENPHIVDTYATALLESGKFLDCIDVLRKNRITESEPRLLEHLGRAYEEARDVNHAVRCYRNALAKNDTTAVLSLQSTPEELQRHVSQLIERNK